MSDITYEELTHWEYRRSCADYILRRTLPMRNWHLMLLDFRPSKQNVGHYLWGIDTKRYNICWVNYCLFASDITYEELTQTYELHFCSPWGEFRRTLPMRNWHSSSMLPNVASVSVGHYLWGIDTCYNQFKILHHKLSYAQSDITYEELTRVYGVTKTSLSETKQSRTLPMRNWHELLSPFIPSSTKKLFRRTLPMRNWHYTQLIHLLHEESEVGHYLWGIDTHCIQWSLC